MGWKDPEMAREYNRRYRAENRESMREYQRFYYLHNRDRLVAARLLRYEQNREIELARMVRYSNSPLGQIKRDLRTVRARIARKEAQLGRLLSSG